MTWVRSVAVFLSTLFFMLLCASPRASITKQAVSYKNIILMIGDGMGENTLLATKNVDSAPLIMETMVVRGQSRTNSWPGWVTTDSAAGATALSCGFRNINGQISTYAFDPLLVFRAPQMITELAFLKGKRAGVVTTDLTSGATPAAFSAHAASRNQEKKISQGQLAFGLDLLWGAKSASITPENVAAAGLVFVDNKADWSRLTRDQKSFAQFSYEDFVDFKNPDQTPSLMEMTEKSIQLLENKAGFFLMVEGAQIDKMAHRNQMPEMIAHTRAFDDAVGVALQYAKRNKDTLVVVTADHETGGITSNQDGTFRFTSTQHTNKNVPLFVNRTDAGFASGNAYTNRSIGAQLLQILE